MTPLPGTLRLRPAWWGLPSLIGSGLAVLASVARLATPAGGWQLEPFLVAVFAALVSIGAVLLRASREVDRLRGALSGLPRPTGGWAREEARLIATIHNGVLPIRPVAKAEARRLFVAAWVIYLVGINLGAGLDGNVSPYLVNAPVVAVTFLVLAGLWYAGRTDRYVRRELVPLAARVAQCQSELITSAMERPRTPG